MKDDPRIYILVEALIKHHVPGKNLSDISEEIIDVAVQEAELLVRLFDELRPPDNGVLTPRQVEHIAAYSRLAQKKETVAFLKKEMGSLENGPDDRYQHLTAGLSWAIEVISETTSRS